MGNSSPVTYDKLRKYEYIFAYLLGTKLRLDSVEGVQYADRDQIL